MAELAKQYTPHEYEEKIYKTWEEAGVFQPDQKAVESGKQPFVIMLPPPNITGTLHMGHAMQDTIMDVLIRYHRMKGDPTLWVPGTDHAAIATNRVLEQQLTTEGTSRFDVGREKFLARADEWQKTTGSVIVQQMKRLGCSCDWTRSRFTMDEAYVRAVNEAFLRYYQKGYIYRGKRIVNWDPAAQTTVSDLEIEWKTEKTPLYILQYGPFEITTARPETKFSDKYVVMHPNDERYAQYHEGQTFTAEWINGPIAATVIKDEAIDPSFGTGVMTITPWHDAIDFSIAERHQLEMEPIIDLNGMLLPIAGEFSGMPITEARTKIVEKLQQKGLVIRVEENYEHNVPLNERGKGVIEPQVMRQWFVSMEKLKKETIEVVEKDLIGFEPPRRKKHFLQWMEQVHDWNINRQIWLGHRLPVWWQPGTRGTDHEEGKYVVSVEKPVGEWQQDPDVLDTWFSSALWPFATLGWPDNTTDLQTFYPTSVLTTAREILELWVARMIFSGLELMQGEAYGNRSQQQRIPFQRVFIHPVVLAKSGQRMSKSLGTGIDPLELIKQYGADATRFGLLYQMSYDQQAFKFDEAAIKSARNFANKIWNLARLLPTLPEREEPTVADQWIQERTHQVTQSVTELIDRFHFGEAAKELYDFVWNDFADWYIEILKIEGSTVIARSVFTTILQLVHPFMPHLTEVLWQHSGKQPLLISSPWPQTTSLSSTALSRMTQFKDAVMTVRSARKVLDIPVGESIDVSVSLPELTQSFEKLVRATIVNEKKSGMIQFPLKDGTTLALGSAHITAASMQQAREKLERELSTQTAFLTHQQKILTAMQGRAEESALTEKQNLIVATEKHIEEIKKSLHALG